MAHRHSPAQGDREIQFPEKERASEQVRSEEHTSELQSQSNLVCRLLLEKKKRKVTAIIEVVHDCTKRGSRDCPRVHRHASYANDAHLVASLDHGKSDIHLNALELVAPIT